MNRPVKRFFLIPLFLISFSASKGQNLRVIDSLLQRIVQTGTPEQKADAYVQIALEYSGSDSINSHLYLSKAVSISDSLGYAKGKADVTYVLSRNSMLRGDYTQSASDLTRLMDLVDSIYYPKGEANGLFGLGWLSYYRGNYEQSIAYHRQSLAIRRVLGDRVDISSSLRGMGITYKLLGDFDQALLYLNQSLEIERAFHNKSGIAECLNHIGVISGLRGDYPAALDAYFEALAIQEEIDDKSGLAYTQQNIGFVHYRQGDFQKTLEYYQRSLEIRRAIGETRGVAQVTQYIGGVYHEQNEYKKALTFYSTALEIKEQLGDKRGVADGYLSIGKLYADQEVYEEAIAYQKKSLELAREINSDWGKVNALIGLGSSHARLRQYAKARTHLTSGIQLAKASKLLESVREAAKLLAEVEKGLGHYQDAYEAQVLFQQASDSLSNEAVTKRITLLEAEYQFAQEKDSIQFANEREKLLLDQKISSQRNLQIAYVTAVIVLVIVLAILFGYYRLKINSNRRLSLLNEQINERNESLTRLNNEKNNLIKIVAHDLKNPLASIIGANDLMDERSMSVDDQKLKGIIQKTATRMSKMVSDILNVETIEKSAEEIRVKPFNLSSTVDSISNQLSGQAAMKEIEIQKRIEEDLMGLVDERYIVQVVENLLSNALKFSPPRKKVIVELTKIRDHLVLHIKDEGPGISSEDKKKLFQRFQRLTAKPTGNESSTGLGLSIVKQFVEKMEGQVWVESELGKGASFFVQLQAAKG